MSWLLLAVSAARADLPVLGPLPTADRDPAGALLWALLRDMAQDDTTAAADVLAREYAAVCAAGLDVACDPARWHDAEGGFDLVALGALMAPRCDAGDALACVGAGWAASQVVPGRYRRSEAPAPDVAYDRFERACAAGLQRGCTELGHLQRFGIGTYASWMRAGTTHRAACQAGEPEACRALANARHEDGVALLERAVRAGHAAALYDLADFADEPEDRRALRVAACEAGVGGACVDAAAEADPVEGLRYIEAGCARRGAAACALVAVARVRADPTRRDDGVAELQELCARSDLACDEAAFLAGGAEPVLGYDGELTDKDIDRTLFDLRLPAHQCLLTALSRDPGIGGTVPIHWRIEPDGRVGGVRVDSADEALAACLAEVWSGARFRAPVGGVARIERDWPLGHDAVIDLTSPLGPEVAGELARIGDGLRLVSQPIDTCFVSHDDPRVPADVVVDVRAGRDGVLREPVLTSGRITDEAARCVVDLVARTRLPTPPSVSTPAQIRIEFAQPSREATPPSGSPGAAFRVERSVPLRILVVMAAAAEVDGRTGRLTEASFASIREAHEEMAAWVEQHTAGALAVTQEFLPWTTPIVAGGIDEDEEGYGRWNLDPAELPDELYARVEQGGWDSVFVWLPVPRGYPRPALGVTFGTPRAQRAAFSSGAIQHKGVLLANFPAPAFELPLHELYHQFEFRALQALGVELPDNHLPLHAGGRVLSPRTWVAENPEVLDWYDEVLGRRIHPDVWRDLLDPDHGLAEAGDLARGARLRDADGLEHAELLVDGYVFGPATVSKRAEATFAVEWDGPRQVSRVVAHLSDAPGGAPTVRKVAVASRSGGAWTALGEASLDVESKVEVRFPAVSVDAVRVTVLEPIEGSDPACRELEVFAE